MDLSCANWAGRLHSCCVASNMWIQFDELSQFDGWKKKSLLVAPSGLVNGTSPPWMAWWAWGLKAGISFQTEVVVEEETSKVKQLPKDGETRTNFVQ